MGKPDVALGYFIINGRAGFYGGIEVGAHAVSHVWQQVFFDETFVPARGRSAWLPVKVSTAEGLARQWEDVSSRTIKEVWGQHREWWTLEEAKRAILEEKKHGPGETEEGIEGRELKNATAEFEGMEIEEEKARRQTRGRTTEREGMEKKGGDDKVKIRGDDDWCMGCHRPQGKHKGRMERGQIVTQWYQCDTCEGWFVEGCGLMREDGDVSECRLCGMCTDVSAMNSKLKGMKTRQEECESRQECVLGLQEGVVNRQAKVVAQQEKAMRDSSDSHNQLKSLEEDWKREWGENRARETQEEKEWRRQLFRTEIRGIKEELSKELKEVVRGMKRELTAEIKAAIASSQGEVEGMVNSASTSIRAQVHGVARNMAGDLNDSIEDMGGQWEVQKKGGNKSQERVQDEEARKKIKNLEEEKKRLEKEVDRIKGEGRKQLEAELAREREKCERTVRNEKDKLEKFKLEGV